MGDDLDLFPKRENLDPFSFGKKEKPANEEKAEAGDELFGQEERPSGSPPDLPPDLSLDHLTVDSSEVTPELPDLPDLTSDGQEEAAPAAAPGMPAFDSPPPVAPLAPDAAIDRMEGNLSDGPISEEKTFDEPFLEQEQVLENAGEKSARKSPSPFLVIGGALIIIIGLLYGALTYLKKDKTTGTITSAPPASIEVVESTPEPAPVPEPETEVLQGQTETQPPVETTVPTEVETAPPEPAAEAVPEITPVAMEPASKPESVPAAPSPVEGSQVEEPSPESAQIAVTGMVQYSIQVGAFILDSSVAELEKKLRGLGYDPFLKKGSTTAMMNMLTVGPFGNIDDARAALSRLKEAGVDSNMRRRNDGTAIINAGSYLLETNATSIMRRIRSLGYPVKLLKQEARLPMTFVRVGRYPGMDDATSAKEELKGRGFDGIVVKLQ
jgi:cell division protein FtsN